MTIENPTPTPEDAELEGLSLPERMAKIRERLAPLTGNTQSEQMEVASKVMREKADRDAALRTALEDATKRESTED